MTLGTDVSRLSTSAANAAAQGLSIVVPLYNEAAGLALLHTRLAGLATFGAEKSTTMRFGVSTRGTPR